MATSDFKKAISFVTKNTYPPIGCKYNLQKNDSVFCNYLIENGGKELQFFMFYDNQSAKNLRKAMKIELNDETDSNTLTGKSILLSKCADTDSPFLP